MDLYQKVVRILFALIFVVGGIAHFILGRVEPAGYAVFGETAVWPWMTSLWQSFVMPNISWLTLVLGIYEIACGLAVLFRCTLLVGAIGMLIFLVFITLVGYGLPAETLGENLLKNRSVTLVMIVMLIPVLLWQRNQTARA